MIIQYQPPPGWRDLERGYLGPHLIPAHELREAMHAALGRAGWQALAYGNNSGPLPLKEQLVDSGIAGDRIENICVTAGTSQALVLLANLLADRGDFVATEELSYDLGSATLSDCGLRILRLPGDSGSLVDGGIGECVARAAKAGSKLAFALVMVRHHNPTGRCTTPDQLLELAEACKRYRVPLVIDDAYGELDFDTTTRVSQEKMLDELYGKPNVVHLRTFSKTLGGGIRLGYLIGDRELVSKIENFGWTRSGGGFNPIVALAVADYLATGYQHHVQRLTEALSASCAAAVTEISRLDTARWQVTAPRGGYFLWIRPSTPDNSAALRSAFRSAQVLAADGARFGPTGSGMFRLSFSSATPDEMERAMGEVVSATLEIANG